MENNDLKSKLRNYQPTPEPEVWDGIQRTLRRRIVVRRTVGGLLATAVVAVAAIVLIPSNRQSEVVAAAPVADNSVMVDEAVRVQEEVATPVATVATPTVRAHETTAAVASLPTEVAHAEKGTAKSESSEGLTEAEIQQLLAQSEVHVRQIPSAAHVVTPAAQGSLVAEVADPVVANPVKNPGDPSTNNAPGTTAEPDETVLLVPNVVIANDPNPVNRTFRIGTNTVVTSFKLYIYNRGGRLVYKTTDINSYWDGTHNGSPVSQGAYVYVIYYSDKDGNPHTLKGTVTLIR